MKTFNDFSFQRSPQITDIASDAQTALRKAPATPPAFRAKTHLAPPDSGPRHHKNFTHLRQLRDHPLSSLVNARAGRPAGVAELKTGLNNIPPHQRLAWLRNMGADKAMRDTVAGGSAQAIGAWAEVVKLLPDASRFAFLGAKIKQGPTGADARHSIATSIFNNSEPDAMTAWGELLVLVPDHNAERSKLLLARTDHVAGTPALASLLERGDQQALDRFVELAGKYVRIGDEDIAEVLFDCLPTMKILTSQRGKVSGLEAQDWVRPDGLKYTKPHELSLTAQHTAQAFGKLVQMAPGKYRNDILFPDDIWSNFPGKNSHATQPSPDQARELAHSITLLKAMVPTMNAAQRETVLNEIRSRHATKTFVFWHNTSGYEKFKKTWPAVDAMLLDLKEELKKAP